jgi:hypothetical protein
MYNFFVRTSFFYLRFGFVKKFVQKIRTFNIDEIDGSFQFSRDYNTDPSLLTLQPSEEQIEMKTRIIIREIFCYAFSPNKISGGVVKVDIYEVDTKIELKVDTFLLGL